MTTVKWDGEMNVRPMDRASYWSRDGKHNVTVLRLQKNNALVQYDFEWPPRQRWIRIARLNVITRHT